MLYSSHTGKRLHALSWQKLGFCIHEQPVMLLHHRGLCQDEIYASMLKKADISVV